MSNSHRPDRSATSLAGRWALVTGASAGIGAATARALAARSCNVVLVARREDRLRALAERIGSEHGVDAIPLALDINDQAALDQALAADGTRLRDVSILVNNAGLAKGRDPMPTASVADWETMVQTNIMGLLRMTRALVPTLNERGGGHVVNLGSVAGRWVYPGGGVYCATKHAVRALSEGLRMDLHGTGVRVTNIEPGLVETEFSVVRLGDQASADKVYENTTPLVAEDIADAIVWSLERPAHVNIQEMVVYPTDQSAITQVHRYTKEAA